MRNRTARRPRCGRFWPITSVCPYSCGNLQVRGWPCRGSRAGGLKYVRRVEGYGISQGRRGGKRQHHTSKTGSTHVLPQPDTAGPAALERQPNATKLPALVQWKYLPKSNFFYATAESQADLTGSTTIRQLFRRKQAPLSAGEAGHAIHPSSELRASDRGHC